MIMLIAVVLVCIVIFLLGNSAASDFSRHQRIGCLCQVLMASRKMWQNRAGAEITALHSEDLESCAFGFLMTGKATRTRLDSHHNESIPPIPNNSDMLVLCRWRLEVRKEGGNIRERWISWFLTFQVADRVAGVRVFSSNV